MRSLLILLFALAVLVAALPLSSVLVAAPAVKKEEVKKVPRWMEKFDPLLIAAHEGEAAEVKKLLEKGSNIKVTASYKHVNGWTALHFAAQEGHEKIIELLIAKGADINQKDKVQQRTPLHLASAQGMTKAVNMLIAKGADVNVKDKGGNTALGLASEKAVIAALKKAGAS